VQYPYIRAIVSFPAGVARDCSRAIHAGWKILVCADRPYDKELSLNAIGTVIAVHSIQITLTLAFGTALWSTRTEKITTDSAGTPIHYEITQEKNVLLLVWKITSYVLLSLISLFSFFVIPRMTVDQRRSSGAIPTHRTDGATNWLSAAMLVSWVSLIPLFGALAWFGFFPGQTRGEKIVDVKNYTFQNDGKAGLLYRQTIPFAAPAENFNGEAELRITLSDSLAKSWEVGNVQGFVGGLGSETKMDPQPRRLRSADPKSAAHSYTLIGVKDGQKYTFWVKLKPIGKDADREGTKELLSTDDKAIKLEFQQ